MANPTAIATYYDALAAFKHQDVSHELAVRAAFAELLTAHARPQQWTLIQEQKLLKRRRPDGTLFDTFRLPRGYWARASRSGAKRQHARHSSCGRPRIKQGPK